MPVKGVTTISRMGLLKPYRLRSVAASDMNALTGSVEMVAMRLAMAISLGAIFLLSVVRSWYFAPLVGLTMTMGCERGVLMTNPLMFCLASVSMLRARSELTLVGSDATELLSPLMGWLGSSKMMFLLLMVAKLVLAFWSFGGYMVRVVLSSESKFLILTSMRLSVSCGRVMESF